MIAILPVSLFGQDNASAMLRSNGIGVSVNKAPVPASIAVFPKDLVETQKQSVARLEASGSTADISPETIVEFNGDELVLEHGTLSVNTSRGVRVRVGCLTVTPVNDAAWTHYDVTDLDGKVTVSALKLDVYIDARSRNLQQAKQPPRSNRSVVREGERKSREEKCGAAYLDNMGAIAGKGAIMNSPWAIGAGAIGIAVLMCFGLCHSDDPMSPTKP
jgi:hypothetical protein